MQTVEERMGHLAQANETRCAGAEVKRRVRALPRTEGYEAVIDLLDMPEPPVGAMRVHTLIASIKRVGPAMSRRLLYSAAILDCRQHARVDSLSVGERARISAVLRRKVMH